MRGEIRAASLFDVEDSADPIKVRDTQVSRVSAQEVEEFCGRYHYAASGGSALWNWGLWHGPILLGVVAYNLPTRDVCVSVFGVEHVDKVWHMGRLALADSAPRNCESRLIAGSLRLIQRDFASVWAVATYAATDAGHVGYVYQATNALYTGAVGFNHPAYFVDTKGRRRSDYAGGEGYVSQKRAAEMGWTKHVAGHKHRYLYLLGDKRQRRARRLLLRWPVLPYPKNLTDAVRPTTGGLL